MSIEGPTILPPNDRDKTAAYALLRITLGTNIAMHGVSRIIAGPAVFSSKLTTQFAASPLPQPIVHAFGQSLPWLEGLFGLLLLIGLRTRAAIVGGALLMLVLTFGSSLVQDWQAASTQLLYSTVYAALLFLLRFNGWSIDALLDRKKKRDLPHIPQHRTHDPAHHAVLYALCPALRRHVLHQLVRQSRDR